MAQRLGIVDAQVHLWEAGSPQQPTHDDHEFRTLDQLIMDMDEAGVARAIITPRVWEGFDNAFVRRAAAAHPDRIRAMGTLDITDRQIGTVLDRWLDDPVMVCARLIAFTRPHHLYDGADGELWAAAEANRVPVMVAAPGSLERIGDIAETHPELKIAIDHMGMRSGQSMRQRKRAVATLLSLSTLHNVAVKVSAAPLFAHDDYPYRSMHEDLRAVVDAFGPRRCFWGTDLSRLPCTYQQAVTMFTDHLTWLDDAALELVMGRALMEWVRW